MGVHDYTCSVCQTPGEYECGEAKGEDCGQVGIGDESPVLNLFFFNSDEAPEEPADFEASLPRALHMRTERRGYDWGDWEFVPSLNYRTLLMDDEDASGIWRLKPFEEYDDGSPIEDLVIPEGQTVWAVNYCSSCHELFVEGKDSDEPPCRLYLEQIAEHLGLPTAAVADAKDKDSFVRSVRERVAKRRLQQESGSRN